MRPNLLHLAMITDPSAAVSSSTRRVAAHVSFPASLHQQTLTRRTFVDSQESMNELLTSAEFLVHVAVPGAVAKPGVTSGGGDAPSWDVEGGGAYVDSRQISYPLRRAVWLDARLARLSSAEDYFHSKKHHLSDLMSMSVNAMYE